MSDRDLMCNCWLLHAAHASDCPVLAEFTRLRAEVEALKHDNARLVETCAEQATEVEQYKRDAERYRWLRQNAEAIQISHEHDGNIGATPWIEAAGFDNYFDAALRGEGAG